ncbi:cytochrome c oxidase subunit 3 [Bordetella hinzii]|jgi:cytochrome c oxidase subunit 3|uniref:cytochrome-c oxidase n=1 Tax=Bordetella hinzii TaxID=103855 RepID=A0AAN1RVK5_9BORD|nr:cytochrome c oxidase subunit 3 [Bordetella hinzii]AKQ57739.1 Cytochrome c oxidase subunit 3 [Bordetella hinzii]AKQ62205.1 Cytochrome c oxidase subunit 3 [Bordetella hinzii]AZW16891.1 cytochrome c oxidase subunit 3 [Bordetella hinzii]KCB28162.1 cytochrome c oxidase, subunit III [Bordetella hinzii CA90 BAL1384]KCB44581.1 cytochrome c oxidase, subunit III [Bordetella hinzii 4161]
MSASHSAQGKEAPYYYVPADSGHPVRTALALLVVGLGAAAWVNGVGWGKWAVLAGFLGVITVLYFWFGEAIAESEGGLFSKRVDLSYRWGMSWFIFSEVMFFAGFFGALWYVRTITTPWLGDMDHRLLLWPDFQAVWPNFGPAGVVEHFQTVGPFWLPTINTALLLTSGVTLTISHHALRANHRGSAIFWLAATVLLGFTFVACQAYEYHHAYSELNLKFNSGAYGSLFYMLTGFHGFHVIMGATMLTVILVRLIRGHFTADHHFGFEGAAWYWHFVDVVWLGLYLFVYWF